MKIKKYTFTFDIATFELLTKLAEVTDMSKIKIVTRALEDYAKKKGVE
jgi:predicted transcriptional regulator